jgi:hypothetical protein
MGQQSLQPARKLGLGDGHVADAGLEVFAVGVHGPDHDLVAEDEVEVQCVGRHLDAPRPPGHAGQHDDAVS